LGVISGLREMQQLEVGIPWVKETRWDERALLEFMRKDVCTEDGGYPGASAYRECKDCVGQ